MEFNVNFGIWSSVFAVPKQIVDNYIKLAGATQLKVILWILCNGGEKISLSDISKDVGKSEDDVSDALQFWSELGVINIENNIISQAETKKQNITETVPKTATETVHETDNSDDKAELPEKKRRVATRRISSDTAYIAERVNSSEKISYLMQEAQVILGRPLSMNDNDKLLNMYDIDGLPVEVITMILRYAVDNGRNNMRYIEKMGMDWGEKEIFTIQMAEEKLKQLEERKKYNETIQSLFGIYDRALTSPEEEKFEKWLGEYKFSENIIKYAYDLCIENTGKYQINYIDKILSRWYEKGLKSIDDVKNDTANNKQKRKEQYESTYDIEEYENYDIFET